eukprot:scaffold39188_cov38-Phaeocystis_antarctica.AAC.1
MGTRSVLSSDGRHRETLGQYGRHSTIWDPPLRSTGSAMQDEGRNEEVNPYEDDLERPRSFAYGKHDLHL